MRIGNAGNTERFAIDIMMKDGYVVENIYSNKSDKIIWTAKKNNNTFEGECPETVLGLIQIYKKFGDDWVYQTVPFQYTITPVKESEGCHLSAIGEWERACRIDFEREVFYIGEKESNNIKIDHSITSVDQLYSIIINSYPVCFYSGSDVRLSYLNLSDVQSQWASKYHAFLKEKQLKNYVYIFIEDENEPKYFIVFRDF